MTMVMVMVMMMDVIRIYIMPLMSLEVHYLNECTSPDIETRMAGS